MNNHLLIEQLNFFINKFLDANKEVQNKFLVFAAFFSEKKEFLSYFQKLLYNEFPIILIAYDKRNSYFYFDTKKKKTFQNILVNFFNFAEYYASESTNAIKLLSPIDMWCLDPDLVQRHGLEIATLKLKPLPDHNTQEILIKINNFSFSQLPIPVLRFLVPYYIEVYLEKNSEALFALSALDLDVALQYYVISQCAATTGTPLNDHVNFLTNFFDTIWNIINHKKISKTLSDTTWQLILYIFKDSEKINTLLNHIADNVFHLRKLLCDAVFLFESSPDFHQQIAASSIASPILLDLNEKVELLTIAEDIFSDEYSNGVINLEKLYTEAHSSSLTDAEKISKYIKDYTYWPSIIPIIKNFIKCNPQFLTTYNDIALKKNLLFYLPSNAADQVNIKNIKSMLNELAQDIYKSKKILKKNLNEIKTNFKNNTSWPSSKALCILMTRINEHLERSKEQKTLSLIKKIKELSKEINLNYLVGRIIYLHLKSSANQTFDNFLLNYLTQAFSNPNTYYPTLKQKLFEKITNSAYFNYMDESIRNEFTTPINDNINHKFEAILKMKIEQLLNSESFNHYLSQLSEEDLLKLKNPENADSYLANLRFLFEKFQLNTSLLEENTQNEFLENFHGPFMAKIDEHLMSIYQKTGVEAERWMAESFLSHRNADDTLENYFFNAPWSSFYSPQTIEFIFANYDIMLNNIHNFYAKNTNLQNHLLLVELLKQDPILKSISMQAPNGENGNISFYIHDALNGLIQEFLALSFEKQYLEIDTYLDNLKTCKQVLIQSIIAIIKKEHQAAQLPLYRLLYDLTGLTGYQNATEKTKALPYTVTTQQEAHDIKAFILRQQNLLADSTYFPSSRLMGQTELRATLNVLQQNDIQIISINSIAVNSSLYPVLSSNDYAQSAHLYPAVETYNPISALTLRAFLTLIEPLMKEPTTSALRKILNEIIANAPIGYPLEEPLPSGIQVKLYNAIESYKKQNPNPSPKIGNLLTQLDPQIQFVLPTDVITLEDLSALIWAYQNMAAHAIYLNSLYAKLGVTALNIPTPLPKELHEIASKLSEWRKTAVSTIDPLTPDQLSTVINAIATLVRNQGGNLFRHELHANATQYAHLVTLAKFLAKSTGMSFLRLVDARIQYDFTLEGLSIDDVRAEDRVLLENGCVISIQSILNDDALIDPYSLLNGGEPANFSQTDLSTIFKHPQARPVIAKVVKQILNTAVVPMPQQIFANPDAEQGSLLSDEAKKKLNASKPTELDDFSLRLRNALLQANALQPTQTAPARAQISHFGYVPQNSYSSMGPPRNYAPWVDIYGSVMQPAVNPAYSSAANPARSMYAPQNPYLSQNQSTNFQENNDLYQSTSF